MSRFDPARLDIASYPFSTSVETRFQDLDPLGHINNVALAALFENGRVRFNSGMDWQAQNEAKSLRWLIARVDINYIAESHFPDPIVVASGVGPIGRSSWTILSAAFQNGQCIGLCDSTLVCTSPEGSQPISDAFRAELERNRYHALTVM